jgi:DNA polymerase-1
MDIKDVVTFDTETYLTAPGRQAPTMVCLTAYDNKLGQTHILLRDQGLSLIRKSLYAGRTLAAHYAVFDTMVIVANAPPYMQMMFEAYAEGRIICTMTIEQMQLIALGQGGKKPKGFYSLNGCSERHLGLTIAGKEDEDAWRFRYMELDGVPLEDWPEGAKVYAINDTAVCNRILKKQLRVMPDNPLPPCLDVTMQSNFALGLMSAWGLRTDPERVQAYKASLDAIIAELRPKVMAAGLIRPDGSKNIAVIRDRIEAALGENVSFTKGGADGENPQIKTGAEQLIEAADACDDEPLKWLAEMTKADKLLSTYMPVLERGTTEVLNTHFGMAESLRVTSSNPQQQNLPRKVGVRECYIPRPGNVFVAADFSQIEMCSLAQVLYSSYGDSAMAEALRAGKELHIETTALFLGITYEEAYARYLAEDTEVCFIRRTLAKAFNFGTSGGMGWKTLMKQAKQYGIDITASQSREYKSLWMGKYYEMNRYFKDIENLTSLGKSGMIEHDLTGFLSGGNTYCQLANLFFQHLMAYGTRKALFAVSRACYANASHVLAGCRPVIMVHDEIIMEAPEPYATACADAMAEIMVREMQSVLPDIPVKVDVTVMRRWSKKAKSKRSENGLYTIWDG